MNQLRLHITITDQKEPAQIKKKKGTDQKKRAQINRTTIDQKKKQAQITRIHHK